MVVLAVVSLKGFMCSSPLCRKTNRHPLTICVCHPQSTKSLPLESQGTLSQQELNFGRTTGTDCLADKQTARYQGQSN
jgi:hypothetical protein